MSKSCANCAHNPGITMCKKTNLCTSCFTIILFLGKTTGCAQVYKPAIRAVINIKKSLNQSVSVWLLTVSTPLTIETVN